MKLQKLVCPFLLVALLCGCESAQSIPSNATLHHEIGESVHEQNYEENSLINLTYPKTLIALLDQKIKDVIAQNQKQYEKIKKSGTAELKSEWNLDYQSYLKDDRYISIKLDSFMRGQEETQEIVETIVYDQKQEDFLSFHDLFQEEAQEIISNEIKAQLQKQYPEECNTQNFAIFTAPTPSNFETFILRKDAIVFYFAQGSVFDHSAYVEVPYEPLEEVSELRQEDTAVFVPYEDVLNEPVKHIDPNQPMVALTFDDGPSKKYTTAILDALKENQASATFFVLGSRASDYPDILQRMILEGNEIGNHTFSHKQLTTLSKENIEEEISATQESIHDVTNHYPQFIRPPYGSKNDTVLQCAQGKKIVTWSLDTEDWKSRNCETIVNRVLADIKDGDIILMHDLYASSAEAAIILIPKLQEMGYQLVTVSELYEYGKNASGKIF